MGALLPECSLRGHDNHNLQFAVLAAAALRGAARPDPLDEAVWWQADDCRQYALFAAVAYIRAALGMPAAASALETGVHHWTRMVKLALGLRTPDIPADRD